MNHPMRRRVISLSLCIAFLGAWTAVVCAADTKSQITDRMAKRLAAVNKAKADGKIGETFDGRVDAVKAASLSEDLQKLVTDENSDRQAFYELGAKETGTTPGNFALSAGKRNFRVAKPEEWLKPKDGKWIQKKDLKE